MYRWRITKALKWPMLIMLVMNSFTVSAQWRWSLDMTAGGAFSIIPGIARDSLISSPGFQAGIRANLMAPKHGGWYAQPNIRSLAHSRQHEDVQFNQLYLELMAGYEWAPSFLNRSSIDLGADFAYLLRSTERASALSSAGNRQYREINPAFRHFAEPYINLNMELSEALSLQAGVHFSILSKAETAELRGRPSHLSLGLRYRVLQQGQSLVPEKTDKNSTLYEEINAFKTNGVLLLRKIPYAKRTEFVEEEEYDIMRYRTDSANLWLQEAFSKHYTFSKIKFVDDSEMDAIVAKEWHLTTTDFEQGKEPPYFIGLVGSYFYEVNRNVNNGLFIYDPEMKFKSLPFPGFSSFRSISQYFYNREALESMVVWFNKAMFKYEAACTPD